MRLIDADRLKETIKELKAESPDVKVSKVIDITIQEFFPQIIDDEPTFNHNGCCICGVDKKMFKLRCSNTKKTLYICGRCAKDIVEQHFSEKEGIYNAK